MGSENPTGIGGNSPDARIDNEINNGEEDPEFERFLRDNFLFLQIISDDEEAGDQDEAAERQLLRKIFEINKWKQQRFDEIHEALKTASPRERAALYAEEHAINCPVTSRSLASYAREFIPYDYSGDVNQRISELMNDIFPKENSFCLNIGDAYRKIDQKNVISFDIRFDQIALDKHSGKLTKGLFPEMPFRDKTFDRVVSVWTASLIMSGYDSEEFKVAIDELIRITRPGGKIFLSPFVYADMDYLNQLKDRGLIDFEKIDQEEDRLGEETYFALVITTRNLPEIS